MRSRLPQPTCTRGRAEVRELGYPTIGGTQNVGKIKHRCPAPDALAAERAYHSAPSKGKDLPPGAHLTGYDTVSATPLLVPSARRIACCYRGLPAKTA
jgi:hypothetical protein